MTPDAVSKLLVEAHRGGPSVNADDMLPADREGAYAIQAATLMRLAPAGGWKVGAKGPTTEPACAPMPAANLLQSGVSLVGPEWALRGIEVELALRVRADFVWPGRTLTEDELVNAFDALLPVIEVVETRLADWHKAGALAKLADLQTHGALVCGAAIEFDLARTDLRALRSRLRFDGVSVADVQGGNPAADIWRMLGWLSVHAARQGTPLRGGDIVTTGSGTGMLFAERSTGVDADVLGIGPVSLTF